MSDLVEELKTFQQMRSTPQYERLRARPVAYFCAEYAFEEEQRRYAGGLGVLAGDFVREAADRGFPLVAVGLYYREGYVCAAKEVAGRSVEICSVTPPSQAGFEPVRDAEGKRLHVSVPIHDRVIKVRVWQRRQGSVTVYMLDTNCEENTPHDRGITDRLYDDDKETRFKQEIVLGIGGLRALEALGIHPSLYHLNEGHSALLALELIWHEMRERNLGFDEAKQFARRRIVLTNHTLLPAGNEVYGQDLAAMLLQRFALELGVPTQKLIMLGLVEQSHEFSMSMLAFRLATVINAVSRLHALKAKDIWPEYPMVAVTNGVHVPTWDRLGQVTAPAELWQKHQACKTELLDHIAKTTNRKWGQGELLVGWARRIVRYKRPMAIIEDVTRFSALARRADQPIRLVLSGLPHPGDGDGKWLLGEIKRLVDGELADVACYLPDYDLKLARLLVSGCDVWLNTPMVGFEACGTSGMKAALNGVLPMSTKDGWVDEAELNGIGWNLNNDHVGADTLDRLEKDITPLYYSRNAAGQPELWAEQMRRCREMIMNQFTATRMLREYAETLYL
ncbi:MAG: alpha-glucan family phosphorylase [Patescibacteria group bacterium]|nr:alpha-glucan family phosphorylase [Patescibacteria group bacterium]